MDVQLGTMKQVMGYLQSRSATHLRDATSSACSSPQVVPKLEVVGFLSHFHATTVVACGLSELASGRSGCDVDARKEKGLMSVTGCWAHSHVCIVQFPVVLPFLTGKAPYICGALLISRKNVKRAMAEEKAGEMLKKYWTPSPLDLVVTKDLGGRPRYPGFSATHQRSSIIDGIKRRDLHGKSKSSKLATKSRCRTITSIIDVTRKTGVVEGVKGYQSCQ
ncbi:hypothetical protein FB45DRAFT_872475 [Roridomyces roridus]|uniref:Uncharacterized protein n=1 Tax=Roridomyces roridus TaxID=1738132 RepID=A0AAD7FDT9_9AGAR|nr:hypothetical protein FB45DRAFT_872475 [Roridomyces roridus]